MLVVLVEKQNFYIILIYYLFMEKYKEYDNEFSKNEIELIDKIIEKTMNKKDFGTKEELLNILNK